MLLRFRPRAALQLRCVRSFSEWSCGSVLGTSTLSGGLLKDLQTDLQHENNIRTRGVGETLQNYVNRAELSHMESPEADEKFAKELSAKVDDLFSRIPLPEDPMRAALALTDEEVKEEAASEMVKEAVREMYYRKLDAKKAEELRLKHAQEKYAKQGMRRYFEEMREDETVRERYADVVNGTASATAPSSSGRAVGAAASAGEQCPGNGEDGTDMTTASAAELRAELAAMRAKMAKLEEMLREKK